MIVLVMLSVLILVDAGPTLSEYLTQDAEARRTCDYDPDNCYYYETCCPDGRCVDSYIGCNPTCDKDLSVCESGQCCSCVYDECSCKDRSDCVDGGLWGIGIAAAVAIIVVPIACCCCCGGCALYWLMKRSRERRAQAQRQGAYMMQPQQMMQPGVHMMQPQQPGMQMMQGGQVQPQGYPTGGFVASPPSYEQGNQAGDIYPSVPNPENVK